MNEALILTCAITSLATLVGLIVAGCYVRRIYREHIRQSDANFNRLADNQLQLAVQPSTDLRPAVDNPITKLSFAESFDPQCFASASRKCALEQVNQLLAARSADGLVITVHSLGLARSGVEMTVTASKAGQELIRKGVARIARHGSGSGLPQLVNRKTGKLIEIMKEAQLSKAMARIGAISTIAVSAAHLVAGADIVDRLMKVDSKVDLLLAYRRIDQLATLERIFTAAKELCSSQMTQEKSWELWRLRGELRELRCGWRREMEHHLNLIEDPREAGWYDRTFTFQKTTDETVNRKITQSELQLGLIEYSLRLDLLLAASSDTIPEFQGSLASEMSEFTRVAGLLEKRASFVSDRYPELSVVPTVDAMINLVEQYSGLLPGKPQQETSPVSITHDSGDVKHYE